MRHFLYSTLHCVTWSEACHSVSWSVSSKIWHPRRRTSPSRWHVRTRSALVGSRVCACDDFPVLQIAPFFLFNVQFGLSLLYALLSQGEKLLSSGVPLEPSIGDFETWCVVFRSPRAARSGNWGSLICILFCFIGQILFSRWLNSCLTAPWWSRSSCRPTCLPSSVATWTSAPCTSWKATWSEFLCLMTGATCANGSISRCVYFFLI